MSERRDHYHALPKDLAAWWRARAQAKTVDELPGGVAGAVGRSTARRRKTGFEVRPMEARDVCEVVELHRTALPDWFVVAAGRRFLEMFYGEALKLGEIAYVAMQDGVVAGFVMGSVRPHTLSRSL